MFDGAWASECKEAFFDSRETAYASDHNDNIKVACDHSEKNAIWAACVVCAGDSRSRGNCKLQGVISEVIGSKCLSTATTRTDLCATGAALVHCD